MYNYGDRVYLLIDEPDGNMCLHIGSLGTVLKDRNGDANPMERCDRVYVRWDEYLDQSDDLDGYDDDHIWFVNHKMIKLCQDDDKDEKQLCSNEALYDFIFGGEQK